MTRQIFVILLFGFIISCKDKTKSDSEIIPVDISTAEWKRIVSDDKKFSIEFPNADIEKKINKYYDDFNEEMKSTGYKLNLQNEPNQNFGYDVSFVPFPEIKTEAEIKERFDEQKEYLIDIFNAEIHYDKILSEPNIPGREIYLTMDSTNAKLTYRMHFKEPNFYMLQVWTDSGKGNLFNKSIAKFLDSFEFIDTNE